MAQEAHELLAGGLMGSIDPAIGELEQQLGQIAREQREVLVAVQGAGRRLLEDPTLRQALEGVIGARTAWGRPC